MDRNYAARVGERLRAIRLQKRLSLHEVEQASGKEFKASVLGAYERGERSISVPRLQRLAQFYGVPTDRLLPVPESTITLDRPAATLEGGVPLDLVALEESPSVEATVLRRFARTIQVARGDFNGKVLTLRCDDLRALAAALAMEADSLVVRLEDLGLRLQTVG